MDINKNMHQLYRAGSWFVLILGSAACVNPTPPPSPEETGAIVTFLVAEQEEYKIRLTDPVDIEFARQLLNDEAAPSIPNGLVVRGESDVNVGYTWHIDPDSVNFVDVTTEVCDGLPSDVEQGIITSEYYCPWAAEVIAIEELN
jgi:hypothetical protein